MSKPDALKRYNWTDDYSAGFTDGTTTATASERERWGPVVQAFERLEAFGDAAFTNTNAHHPQVRLLKEHITAIRAAIREGD